MNRPRRAALLGGLLAIAALAGGCSAPAQGAPDVEGQRFGLVTSLPIYRAPAGSVAEALGAGGQGETTHWLRAAIEAGNALDPIDLIDAESLARTDFLLLIQPRALTPDEYVALDKWVRDGGRVLLVADPMLSGEPRFALGDPRNPQAISVTGPIHARWGLELEGVPADHAQDHAHHPSGMDGEEAESQVRIGDNALPVVLGGSFAKRPPAGGDPADCALRHRSLVAVCAIGKGQAVLIADATLFERQSAAGDGPGIFWDLLGMFGDAPEK